MKTNKAVNKPKFGDFMQDKRAVSITYEEALENKIKFDRIDADRAVLELGIINKNQNIGNLESRSGIPDKYRSKSFDDYHVLNAKQMKVLGICSKYAIDFQQKSKCGSSLVLAGGTNTGKTHLACAIANHIISNQGKVIYVNFAEMLRKIKSPWNMKNIDEQKIINEFSKCLLLIIDEVGVQFGTDFEKNALFEIINNRSSRPLPTILISNHSMSDVKNFIGERTVSRIRRTGGRFLTFDWEPYRPRVVDDPNLLVNN